MRKLDGEKVGEQDCPFINGVLWNDSLKELESVPTPLGTGMTVNEKGEKFIYQVQDLMEGGSLEGLLRKIRLGGIGLGIVALALGSIALRAADPGNRERGWELAAIGVAALGVGWLAGTAAAAGGGAAG